MAAVPDISRVLVVDDDEASRFILRAHLARAGHQVEVASDAATAVETLKENGIEHFEVVVSDYWMPGGTGLELLKQLHSMDPTLGFIIVTAEGERRIVKDTLREGGCDHLDKPVAGQLLRDSVAHAAARTRKQRSLRKTAEAARAVGRQQQHLLERHTAVLRDSVELFYHSHSEASGDFMSLFPLPGGRVAMLASDASGHDLQSAFQSNYFHGIARGMMQRGASAGEVFSFFNGLLLDDWNDKDSVALSLAALGATIDPEAGRIEVLNCGFPIPMLADAEGMAMAAGDEQGAAPLGWFLELPPVRIENAEDGTIVAWSDGLSDLAVLQEVDPLALAHRLLVDGSDALAPVLASAADDLIAIRVRVGGASRPAGWRPLLSRWFSGDEAVRIDTHHQWIERSLRLALPAVSEDSLGTVMVCAREALINALVHGCGRSPGGRALVQIAVRPDGQRVMVRVSDTGCGYTFDVEAHEAMAAEHLLTEHRGLVLMRHLASDIVFSSQGAVVTMQFPVSGPQRK